MSGQNLAFSASYLCRDKKNRTFLFLSREISIIKISKKICVGQDFRAMRGNAVRIYPTWRLNLRTTKDSDLNAAPLTMLGYPRIMRLCRSNPRAL